MNTNKNSSTIILVPGHWLGAWAWDHVMGPLRSAGHYPIALTLPGLDPNDSQRASRTITDQAAAVEAALLQASSNNRPVILVAHSGATAPVSICLDQHPELVDYMVWVDSGPVAPGSIFAPDFPADLVEWPLPAFETLALQASLAGLTDEDLAHFKEKAVAQPGPVMTQPVELSNSQRLSVPTTMICCSLPSEQIIELAEAGHPMFSEVAHLQNRNFVDLPTGHWPMWSQPEQLAEAISSVADGNKH